MNARFAPMAWSAAAMAALVAAAGVSAAETGPADTHTDGTQAAGGMAASPLRLFAADSNRRMTLPVGTVLRVDLDANYSTGAEWQRRDAFGAVLESVPCAGIVREPLVKRGEPAPPVGTGTTASYCFRAATAGRAYLYLFYGRAWTPEAPAWDQFVLDVTVTPAD